MLECVINVSEGRDPDVLATLGAAAGSPLLDVHTDAHHHRSVFTLAGETADVEAAARRLAAATVEAVDLGAHSGVHPRLGALDVVPWVDLRVTPSGRLVDGDLAAAVGARDRFARWAADELGLPCFLYGPAPAVGPADNTAPGTSPADDTTPAPAARPDNTAPAAGRTLPELRARAWREWSPDTGPDRPHRSAGAACVGARPVLVAFNLRLADADLALARAVARAIRAPQLRALGLAVGDAVQVSCNLVAPWVVGPAEAYDAVASHAEVARAELVGLVPLGVLDAVPAHRWAQLDLDASRTIEARLERAGLDGGRFPGA